MDSADGNQTNTYQNMHTIPTHEEVKAYHLAESSCPGTSLRIIKHTRQTDCNTNAQYFKGLIYDCATMKIVAPAVKIPKAIDQLPQDYKPMKIMKARDGIQYRLYQDPSGKWRVSTNSFIHPVNRWGSPSTFLELWMDSFDTDSVTASLNPEYCYFIWLEHPDHHNIVKHSEIKRTVFRVVSVATGEEIDLDEIRESFPVGGLDIAEYISIPRWIFASDKDYLSSESLDQPALAPVQDVGFLTVSDNGDYYRFETLEYQAAKKLRGNNMDIRKHWTALTPDERETYLKYFPDVADTFADMDYMFHDVVKFLTKQYYRKYNEGKYVRHHPRHFKIMNEMNALYGKECGETQIVEFLQKQDPPRLFYVLNPDEL